MERPSIGKKPSKKHIIWTSDKGSNIKRFHEEYLRKWCEYYGFDFETYKRVDHDRSSETRQQYQCAFSYQEAGTDSVEIDGTELSIQNDETPRTFVEIDEEGVMRVQGWSIERIVDVIELWHEDSELIVKAADEENLLRLDATDLAP
jgi:hypothetical protein